MAEPTTAEERRAERLARFRAWLASVREELGEEEECAHDAPSG